MGAVPFDDVSGANRAILENLQGNILKAHGLDQSIHIFIRFRQADITAGAGPTAAEVEAARRFLGTLLDGALSGADGRPIRVTSAAAQKRPMNGAIDEPFVSVALAKSGYDFLNEMKLDDPAFIGGMAARGHAWNDPPPDDWELGLRTEPHALITLADTEGQFDGSSQALWAHLISHVDIVGSEIGAARYELVNGARQRVEHFGYVDGHSQPVLLKSQADRLPRGLSWDPVFGPETVLVPCPHRDDESGFGSYLVFRKLEQNVAAFKGAVAARAAAASGASAGLTLPRREAVAGAEAVGRFEDGTPLAVAPSPSGRPPPPDNDFTYSSPPWRPVPADAHTLLMNPRDGTERANLFPRRGITYGAPAPSAYLGLAHAVHPEGGVGLLFMGYMSDIAGQFEELQKRTVGDAMFGGGRFVRLLGGGYFFAPSLAGLGKLAL